MIRFECDYTEGAHPKILEMLIKTNLEQTAGYGLDIYCDEARELIKKQCKNENIDVHFLVGGTQANMTVIDSVLRPYQGVISAQAGHINVHETGAIESKGHKVLSIASDDGKITADDIVNAYNDHWNDSSHEHIVQPGMVYISSPTENGTIYTKSELEQINKVCKDCELYLFMDGARLGYGLMSDENDLILEDISKLCDVFYIGGTKIGALFGEAVVISNAGLKKDFRYYIKQNGGMLAKGRLLGIQFLALFEDNLYFEISKHANIQAMRIKKAFSDKGYTFRYDSSTNQQFPIIPDDKLEILNKKYSSSFLEKIDNLHTAVRFCTSWATSESAVDELIEDIHKL